MDKTLRDGLQILLLHTTPEAAIGNWLRPHATSPADAIPFYKGIDESFVELLIKTHPDRYSRDDASRVKDSLETACSSQIGWLSLLLRFAEETLTFKHNIPVVRYEEILRWRDATHALYVQPFFCSFMAKEDYLSGITRAGFSLNPVLATNNARLDSILSRGMAENHFHLKGSAPVFLLSWIYLMNNMAGAKRNIEKIERHFLSPAARNVNTGLYPLVWKAALIRAYLFSKLESGSACIDDDKLADCLESGYSQTDGAAFESSSIVCELPKIQNSLLHSNIRNRNGTLLDYAICDDSQSAFSVFSGEIRFLYKVFYALFSDDNNIRGYIDLFVAYLMIATRFRSELVQCNANFGFANFSEYQKRKEWFLGSSKKWRKILEKTAIETNLADERLHSLELRVSPPKSASTLQRTLADLNKLAGNADSQKMSGSGHAHNCAIYYVLHFPKRADNKVHGLLQSNYCRHETYRKEVYTKSRAIITFREQESEYAACVRGIDACANEIGCRPEVFAPAFRMLKAHRVNSRYRNTDVPNLKLTYHAGEDFLDIVDGLRAIDESLIFLEMSQGDRLGHGMALGVEPKLWYSKKSNRIVLSRQELLDNCVWMFHRLSETGFLSGVLMHTLRVEISKQIAYVYQKNLPFPEKNHFISPEIYMNSWLLRGDKPDSYKFYQKHEEYLTELDNTRLFDRTALRDDSPGEYLHQIRRYDLPSVWLYHHYHYNPNVKHCGSEIVEFEVDREYIRGAEILQKVMQRKVRHANIGIETNPSSNVLIGNFNRYDRLPLVKFFDKGLFDADDNPGLFISINTDDQGVFETNLENEYALVSRALEQIKGEYGERRFNSNDIYSWIDQVREMGLAQSFATSADIFRRTHYSGK